MNGITEQKTPNNHREMQNSHQDTLNVNNVTHNDHMKAQNDCKGRQNMSFEGSPQSLAVKTPLHHLFICYYISQRNTCCLFFADLHM